MDDDIERKDNNVEQTTMPIGNICLDIEFYTITSLSHHHIVYNIFNTIYSFNDPL